MFQRRKRGPYTGRLAFDPDTGFHTDPQGRKVVTDDHGRTWRYAEKLDPSHNARYQQQVAVIDTTANEFAELEFRHGPDVAARMVSAHHFEAQLDDAHFDHAAPGKTKIKFDPDVVAATVTSHTDAYRG